MLLSTYPRIAVQSDWFGPNVMLSVQQKQVGLAVQWREPTEGFFWLHPLSMLPLVGHQLVLKVMEEVHRVFRGTDDTSWTSDTQKLTDGRCHLKHDSMQFCILLHPRHFCSSSTLYSGHTCPLRSVLTLALHLNTSYFVFSFFCPLLICFPCKNMQFHKH